MLNKRFLFRFKIPCRSIAAAGTGKCYELDETYRLPNLAELEDNRQSLPFELRIGWNNNGLAFSLLVWDKKQHPWCRNAHIEESDGIQICLNTRDVSGIHRATRFCHRLAFLPAGSGYQQNDPGVFWFPIHRAKEHPNPINLQKIKLNSSIRSDGYRLNIWVPSDVLTGYEPREHSCLGFHFVLIDREHGHRYFLAEPPFPHDQDPSLWGTLELANNENEKE
jgi:hypothetical protein